MVYLKTSDPAVGGKSILIQNAAIPVESGAENGQKSIRINNIAIPLKDFPAWRTPEIGDKCLLIPGKKLCIPVYRKNIEMPTDGLIFYASLSDETSTAETGQAIEKNGNISFETVSGVPCAHFDGSSYFTLTPSGTEFKFLTQTQWTILFHILFERGTDESDDLEGVLCSEEPNRNGALFSYRYIRGWSTSVQNSFGIGVNGNSEFTTPANLFQTSTWYFIAIERNGSALRMRVNDEWYDGGNNSHITDASTLYLPGGSPKLKGGLAGLRIYNRLLSDDEYLRLKNEFEK